MKALFNWLEDRTGVGKLTREALFETVPGGARWRYAWGSTLTFAIVVQFITGMMLWMFYSPSATTAWESVYHIQNNVTGGKWLRGIHHYTSQVMVILLVLHLAQVLIDHAYKAPREFNFWFGLILIKITLALGLTGYLLPWDQKGFWATEVATNIAANVPIVGDMLKRLIVGGSEYGHHTLTRFFALHAGILPGALVGLIAVHIYLFRKHGITEAAPKTRRSIMLFWYIALLFAGLFNWLIIANWQFVGQVVGVIGGIAFVGCLLRIAFLHIKRPPQQEPDKKPRRGNVYFWPDQVLRDAVVCGLVLLTVLGLVWYFDGADLSSPANPAENYSAARPDWYFMALFYLLKKTSIVMGAFVIPGAVAAVVFIMPLLGRWRAGHYLNIVILIAVIGALGYGTFAAFKDDWQNEGYKASVASAHRDAERIQELAKGGIPPEGALSLMREDPYIQGPKLFAANCASCHAYDGHDGTGKKRKEDEQLASDLKGFASREWVAAILNPETFQDVNHFGGTQIIKGEKKSKMLGFLEENLTDLDAAGQKEVSNIVKALSAESALKSQVEMDAADAAAIEEGKELIGEDGLACTDCHKFYDQGRKGPDLTGYGSRQWTIDFIMDPSHKRFYGDRNDKMPIFGPKVDENGNETRPAQLSDSDIGMITDWLRGDWFEPEVE